jgi:hypothetical protein
VFLRVVVRYPITAAQIRAAGLVCI